MNIQSALLGAALVSLVLMVISSECIVSALRKRGVRVFNSYMRYLSKRNLRQYADITRRETGCVGVWLVIYLASIVITLAAGLPALLLR